MVSQSKAECPLGAVQLIRSGCPGATLDDPLNVYPLGGGVVDDAVMDNVTGMLTAPPFVAVILTMPVYTPAFSPEIFTVTTI
jgi:hypothetical protein